MKLQQQSAWLLPLLLCGYAAQGDSNESTMDSAAWERELVEAWRTIGDCSPSTGMCEHCGFGAVVVDLTSGQAETRFYTVGPEGRDAPFGSYETWEIASVTKPFTALASLILEEEGLLSTETSTIGDFLDCNWEAAHSDVASVTLLELIQHESGLPAQPPDRGPSVDGNPFADYTHERLCASLLDLNGLPTRGRYSYSNYAYGTLGYLLTLAINKENPPSYEDVIKEKILEPLQMHSTSVTYDDAGWEMAVPGCDRGLNRGQETIRLGAYATLQGNGALRSNLVDMSKYLLFALYVDGGMPPPTQFTAWPVENSSDEFGDPFRDAHNLPPASPELDKIYRAFQRTRSKEHMADLACSCVSDWCEGLLCPLPNPNHEFITVGGMEGYTSGGILGWRKSGDTGGYSSRLAFSAEKGRGVVAVDTCGGCGSRGTAGSGAQRAALLLVDGPPKQSANEEYASTPLSQDLLFSGDAHSHNFPSVAQINIELTPGEASGTAQIALASSDGAGARSTAVAGAQDGTWSVNEPIFIGTGWGADADPFTQLAQQRQLIIYSNGTTATYQDMGSDTYLDLVHTTQTTRKLLSGDGAAAVSLRGKK